MFSLSSVTYTLSPSEYFVSWIQLQLGRPLSGLVWSELKGMLTTATVCNPESLLHGKQTRTKCSCSWAVWHLRTVLCISVPKVLSCLNNLSPDTFLLADVLSRGSSGPPGLSSTHRNTLDEQCVLSTTRGRPGPVKVTQNQPEKTTRDQQGILRTAYHRSLTGSQLRASFQYMNFIPSPANCFLTFRVCKSLLNYRISLHFQSEMTWKWFFMFQDPGNGVTGNWIIMVRTLIV
jgi:hypothetical protein